MGDSKIDKIMFEWLNSEDEQNDGYCIKCDQ